MKTKSTLLIVPAISGFLLAMLCGNAGRAQDLPFISGSTGADGPLQFVSLAPGPNSGRYAHALAYDATRQQTVLFGGYSSGYRNDTWVFNGTNWTQLGPATNPPARHQHAMAYDSSRQQTVLFSGISSIYLNDTWVFNGTNWTQLSPATNPPARYEHAMAYDSARQQVVLFGGYASGYPSDTWVFDGTNWAQLSPATNPPARQGHAMAYDSARQQVVLFGGVSSGGSYLSDTWVFDGTNWTQLSPATRPSARYLHAMAYDATRQQAVLFGGYSGSSDTWVFNGTNWTQLSLTTRPSGRYEHAMAYDSTRQQVVLFGGYNGSVNFNDTWLFDGTNWNFSSDTAQLVFDMRLKPDGVWNYSSIDISGAAIIKFIKNAANTPVVWLATSNVTINGTLDLSGQAGLTAGAANQLAGNEAPGGPGGFAGGLGGIRWDQSGSFAGTPGQGPGGGLPGVTNSQAGAGAKHISTYGNAYLQPLIGGSGGGGRGSSPTANGYNGGGGGGAIYISSSRDIVVNGEILANGGSGSSSAGGGSGGAVRLQADRVSGNGRLEVSGGGGGSSGESGRIRLEAFFRTFLASGTYSGTLVGSAPVTNATFQLTGNLLITSVAGQNVVQPPGGNTQNPDVVFTATGPISVTATSTNIPTGTPVVLRVTSSGQVIQATNNLAGGTATFGVTVPAGVGTIQASATYTISN